MSVCRFGSVLTPTLLSLSLALAPARAIAADATWAQTFDTSAVVAHVSPQGGDVVVITAGKRSNGLRDAARALQAELEESGTAGAVTLVSTNKAQARLDDAALLDALSGDADRAVVVRFDGTRATVSVYDAAGLAIGGFSAGRGDAIEPPAETTHEGDSTLAILEDAPEIADEALIEYERKKVVFDGSLRVTAIGSNSARVSRDFAPQTGAGAPLPEDEFYSYIGRDDLAKEYRRRKAARSGLIAGGGVAMLTGVVVMLAVPLAAVAKTDDSGLDCFGIDDPVMAEACEADADAAEARAESRQQSQVRRGLGIGGGLLAGGIVLSVVGGRIRPHAKSAAELQELGDAYNADLRKRLGLREVVLRGSANRNGGGLVLSGRF